MAYSQTCDHAGQNAAKSRTKKREPTMRLFSAMTASAVAAATSLFATIALADDQLPELPVRGAPVAGGTALQDPASSVASGVVFLDNLLLWIIVPITIFGDRAADMGHRVPPQPSCQPRAGKI